MNDFLLLYDFMLSSFAFSFLKQHKTKVQYNQIKTTPIYYSIKYIQNFNNETFSFSSQYGRSVPIGQ